MKALTFFTCIALVAGPVSAGELPLVGDAELDQQRGGYLLAGSLLFDLEATMRTYDEWGLALQTDVVLTPEGPQVTRIGVGGNGGANYVHHVADGSLLNIVTNTDSDRLIRQETDITLTLPGFEQVQANMAKDLFGLHLGDDVATAGAMSVGR